MQQPKLVIVQSYSSRTEADLAKGALEDAGIQEMIQADTEAAPLSPISIAVQHLSNSTILIPTVR